MEIFGLADYSIRSIICKRKLAARRVAPFPSEVNDLIPPTVTKDPLESIGELRQLSNRLGRIITLHFGVAA